MDSQDPLAMVLCREIMELIRASGANHQEAACALNAAGMLLPAVMQDAAKPETANGPVAGVTGE